jgi:hypothetical protein
MKSLPQCPGQRPWTKQGWKLNLAPGVTFDGDRHEYWYNGKKLSGVTGLVSKKLGIKMPQEFVEEHQMEGIHVHRAVQRWIETGTLDSIHPGVLWLTETFAKNPETGVPEHPTHTQQTAYAEALVSDFKRYASAVDIVWERPDGGLTIYDIKKGVFKRDYVTWQLSIYKYFIEKYAGRKVDACVCVCLKDKEYYDIFPKGAERVEKLLYGGV